MTTHIVHGDCLDALKIEPENSVDAVITDPPYGLSFMGKKWDYDVPSKEMWVEALRVLKPGGHLLSFGGTRTYHRMVVNIEDAGFEIRDQIQWIYGSGFPKSHNLDGEHEGWGTALKPANEPIVLARKPLSESTVAKNVIKWGTGALNVDGSRIGTEVRSYSINGAIRGGNFGNKANQPSNEREQISAQGRWPANVIFDEQAAFMLDEQSGQFAGSIGRANRKSAGQYEASNFKVGVVTETETKDFGGASRFFYCAKSSKAERNRGLEGEAKQKQGARPSSADATGKFPDHDHRPTGGNNHPTVKPIKLMKYLCRLVTPPNGIILDPFMGSGSTGVAAKNLGFDFIGIEMNEEYVEIAKRRIG